MFPLPARIVAKIRIEHLPNVPEEWGPCWRWLGGISGKGSGSGRGYGRLWWDGWMQGAHRVIWRLFTGLEIPEGKILDHRCRYRVCCNPYHVEPVTHRVNTARGNGSWIFQQRSEAPF